ncbi:uncharacterized protein BP5553_03577 [Venustampulla echinocandica]|uniref:Bromodomain-containing protein n=1 Tax=Venustampulla echinocandica TaxID=2656787 RepID=A0A370TUN0_9HELO|nr:uncharacterized protein BP5553_03577 [Venustampulla echinocandica]RDL39237.1 hypothetical protein BP5553_03577 [Venustampulla echinocandica]
MPTHQSEGVAFEEKTQPVPSDSMALDLDINGETNANQHETTFDSTSPEVALNKHVEISSSADVEVDSRALEVNGTANRLAFSENQDISVSPVDIPLESQLTADTSPSAPNSSHFPDTNTTTTEVGKLSISPETPLASADSILESAMDDVAAAVSSIPPVVEAQNSDLRDSSIPPPPADSHLSEQQPQTDLSSQDAQVLPESTGNTEQPAMSEDIPKLPVEQKLPDLPKTAAHDQSVQQSSTDVDMISPERTERDQSMTSPAPPERDQNMASPQLVERDQNKTSPPLAERDQSATSAPAAERDQNMASPPLVERDQNTTGDATKAASDIEMNDSSQQSAKVAREREDDDEAGPSAKRPKTEEAADTDAGMSMIAQPQNGPAAPVKTEGTPITPYQTKEMIKILKNVAKTAAGKNFRLSVNVLWPGFAEPYYAKISDPIDLNEMEVKLKNKAYPDIDAFKADCELVAENALKFNGADHLVTIAGQEVRDSLLERIANIPPEPAPAPKKEKKPKRSTPVAEAPRPTARRTSRPAAPNASVSVPPAPTFALDPSTSTPLIRRDSTKGDGGRPKREIHPPKNKDLPYSIKPKSKKFATELKFCEEVLTELKKPKYAAISHPFIEPVDPVALNIPNYFTIIKSPMDLSTVSKKLSQGAYGTAKDFEKDVKLIFANCYKYNPGSNPIHQLGKQFEELFQSEWEKKQQWIAEHSPSAAPSSPAESEDEESDDEEHEESTAIVGGMSSTALRLIEEQKKLIDLMTAKKKDPGLIQMQQALIEVVQNQVQKESQAVVKKPKKPKASKPKKPAPAKKGGNSGKKSGNRQKYLGTVEKEVISAGLTSLPDDVASTVLDMIKADQPGVDIAEDGTLELDIDIVSTPTLWKIHGLIMEYAPEVDQQVRRQFEEREAPRALAKPAAKKKNKPMSKTEQERNIETLRSRVQEFERQGSGSQEPVIPTVERHEQDSSGDEDSDSEEE